MNTLPQGYQVVAITDTDGDADDTDMITREVIMEEGTENEWSRRIDVANFIVVPEHFPVNSKGGVDMKFIGSIAYLVTEEGYRFQLPYYSMYGETREEAIRNFEPGGEWVLD